MAERLILFYACVLLLAAFLRSVVPLPRLAPAGHAAWNYFIVLWLGAGAVYLTVFVLLLLAQSIFG